MIALGSVTIVVIAIGMAAGAPQGRDRHEETSLENLAS
jgi:hypothetical protein